MGMQVNNQIPDGNDHLTAQNITEWINGWCSDDLQLEYRQHCIRCADCRERVAMISKSTQPDAEMDQSPEFQELLRIGEQAALRVWQGEKEIAKPKQKPKPWEWIQIRPSLIWAGAAILLLALAIPGYRYWQSNQPVERAMSSMRQAWNRNRPIETRVTGNFPYLPYAVTRGSGDKATVNQAQLLAATADLAREVAERPTPKAKHALGRLHLLKQEFDEAEKLLKEVVSEEPKNAAAHVDLASVYYELGVAEQSLPFFFKSAEHLKTAIGISPKLAEAWFNLALCHEQMKLTSQAISDWERYLELDSTSSWAGEAREKLKKLHERAAITTPPPSKLADELLAADASGDEAKTLKSLAENFIEISNVTWEYLLDRYLETLSSADQTKAEQLGHTLSHLAGLIHETKKDAYFRDQFKHIKALNPMQIGGVKEVRTLLAQGDSAHQIGEYKKAVAFYFQALSAAKKASDLCHAEKAMFGLARTYTPQTETPRMAVIRRQLVAVAGQRQHLQFRAKALIALSNQHLSENKYSLLLEASSEAYEIAQQISDFATSTNSLRFIAGAYARLGKTDTAFKNYFAALQTLEFSSTNPLLNCQLFTAFSLALANKKNYQGALDYQLEALPYCRQCNDLLFASAQGRAWKYVVLTGQNEQSVSLLHSASFGAKKYNEATGMNSMLFDLKMSLGDAYLKQKQPIEAASAYTDAIKLLGQNQSLHYQSGLYHGLALAYLQQNKNDEGEAALNKSIELEQQARRNISEIDNRSAFTGSRSAVYQTMIDFQYFIKKSASRAFDYAEVYRSRELFDLITQHKGLQWDSARMRMALSGISTAKTINQIQALLPANVQLIEYAFTEQNLLIWVVSADRVETVSVPFERTQFQTLVAEYLTGLKQRESANSLNAKARQLYQLLVRPVEAYLNKDRILVFVPDGILKAIPFAALVSPSTNRYLMEDYALAVSPSASILAQLIERGSENSLAEESLLMVSNPRFSQKLFPMLRPLPGTDEEILNLRLLYPGLRYLSGEEATKKALLELMGKFAVVHLATHSFLDEKVPLSSAIVLASNISETKEASVLTAHEILQLKLPKTRLIVLSSCLSAASESVENPATLAQAFFSAGVPAVIGSLWEVEDMSTARLMTAFHRAYQVEKLNPCQALRRAQLAILNAGQGQWRHPYYWAAFLLSGNGFNH